MIEIERLRDKTTLVLFSLSIAFFQKIMNNRKMALAASLSMNLAGPIIGGFLLGYFLDRWLGTTPWLILILGLLGTAGGFISLYRIAGKLNQESDDE